MTSFYYFNERLKQIAASMMGLICVFLPPFVHHNAHAGACDPVIIQSTIKDDELAYRNFSNRCEGFYSAKVSNPAFKVVGFTIGKFIYSMQPTEVIKISIPNHQNRTIRIQANAIANKTYYRMDALITGHHELHWPVKDIIFKRPDELTSGKTAVIGWTETDHKKIFVPLLVTSSATGSGDDRQPRLCISALSDLAVFKWRAIMPAHGGGKSPGRWKDPLAGNRPVRTGQAIIIELTHNATGMVDIELAARIKNSRGWITHFIILDLGH